MSVKDKVIVITGAASGIGRETARHFASKGAKVSLADVQEKPLQELEAELKELGADVFTQVVDIRKRKDVEDWIAASVQRFGKLDGAANLAGVTGKQSAVASIEDVEDDDWDFIMDVNVGGLRNCLRAQIANMNEGGSIVNVASILGLVGAPQHLAYCASKHAVVGMSRVAAKELGSRKIRVNCVCPGPIQTPMLQKAFDAVGKEVDYSWLALGRSAQQEEVTPLIEFLLSDGASFMTGNVIPVDGGWFC